MDSRKGSERTPRIRVTPTIFEYLASREVGELITLPEIAVATGYDKRQIQNALTPSRIQEKHWPLRAIAPGHVWERLREPEWSVSTNKAEEKVSPTIPASDTVTFRILAETATDALILEDIQDKSLWLARAL